jgi:putative colanic acid biosynthesis acetyltransferase WcaF
MTRYYREEKPHFCKRLFWMLINRTIFRLLIGIKLYWARNAILKAFGANIQWRCNIYASVEIYAPWNLTVGKFSTIGPGVNVFNKSAISIGSYTTISQNSYLCTGSHKINSLELPPVDKDIAIGDFCWIASCCFIGPGVSVSEGCVVSATSSLFEDTENWYVYRGNPAQKLKQRNVKKP